MTPDETTVTIPVPLEGTVNSRDLAGLPTASGERIAPNVLLRSDNLQDLTPGDVETLVEGCGLRAVVDLRTEFELRSEGPGPLVADDRVRIAHHSLYPASGGGTDVELDAGTVKPWGDGLGAGLEDENLTVNAYFGYLMRRPDSIVAALRVIAATDGAVLVHCAAGKDRTGVVVALALHVAGVPVDAIAADYVATAENIEAIVARLAATETYAREMDVEDASRHAPRPGAMERLFELLDEREGGAAVWLTAHGFGPEEQARLRARLLGA